MRSLLDGHATAADSAEGGAILPCFARFVHYMLPAWCAMLAHDPSAQHFEADELELLQQVAGPEPGKSVVPPQEVRRAVGADLGA